MLNDTFSEQERRREVDKEKIPVPPCSTPFQWAEVGGWWVVQNADKELEDEEHDGGLDGVRGGFAEEPWMYGSWDVLVSFAHHSTVEVLRGMLESKRADTRGGKKALVNRVCVINLHCAINSPRPTRRTRARRRYTQEYGTACIRRVCNNIIHLFLVTLSQTVIPQPQTLNLKPSLCRCS